MNSYNQTPYFVETIAYPLLQYEWIVYVTCTEKNENTTSYVNLNWFIVETINTKTYTSIWNDLGDLYGCVLLILAGSQWSKLWIYLGYIDIKMKSA